MLEELQRLVNATKANGRCTVLVSSSDKAYDAVINTDSGRGSDLDTVIRTWLREEHSSYGHIFAVVKIGEVHLPSEPIIKGL